MVHGVARDAPRLNQPVPQRLVPTLVVLVDVGSAHDQHVDVAVGDRFAASEGAEEQEAGGCRSDRTGQDAKPVDRPLAPVDKIDDRLGHEVLPHQGVQRRRWHVSWLDHSKFDEPRQDPGHLRRADAASRATVPRLSSVVVRASTSRTRPCAPGTSDWTGRTKSTPDSMSRRSETVARISVG